MKTISRIAQASGFLLQAGKNMVLTLLAITLLSTTLSAKQRVPAPENSEIGSCSTCEEEKLIQQWTEEINPHIPQLNVSAKLSSLQDAASANAKNSDQLNIRNNETEQNLQVKDKGAKKKSSGAAL